MAFNSFTPDYPYLIKTTLQATSNTTVLGYKLSYTVGISPKIAPYSLSYKTNNLSQTILSFDINYTKQYDDTSLFYSLSYMVNRDVIERTLYGRISYDSTVPRYNILGYTFAYSFEKTPTSKVIVASIRYDTSWFVNKIFPYSLAYNSKGSGLDLIRKRYTIPYNTSTVATTTFSYKFKYNVSYFNNNINPYTLSFTTVSPEKVLTDTAIVQTQDGRYDLLIRLRGTLDRQKDEYFYVFSNLPKYQILEYSVDEDLPYLDKLSFSDVSSIFDSNSYNNYQELTVFRLKGIEPNNPISVDVYTYPDYKKANKAKSYFFSLTSSDFITTNRVISNERYISYNISSDAFQYEYLNFTDVSVTPVFNTGDSCCFSQKILKPNSKVVGGGCSPF